MAGIVLNVPDFDFSAFYYPQLVEALTLYKRRYTPELTDESDHEPAMQLLKAFALVGHLNNVLLDMVANENTLPTAQLPETVRNMLRLIDFEMSPAAPAQVDMVFELSRVFTAAFDLIPDRAQMSTRRTDGETPVIFFEVIDGLSIERTDLLSRAFGEVTSGTFDDHTTSANNGTPWQPFGATPIDVGNALYFGHESVMFDRIDLDVVAPADIAIGVWEFYDGDVLDVAPDSVTNLGAQLEFDLTGLLGDQNRAGALVRVTINDTGAFEEQLSTWDGAKNVVTTSLIGQSSPSTTAGDYSVGVEWQEMESVSDSTANLAVTGPVTFTLPQDENRNWQKSIQGGFEAFWVRFRVIALNANDAPTLGRCRIDLGSQYALAQAVQGKSVVAETLGSSTGEADQRFPMQRENFVWGSEEVRVDGEAWTRVRDFLDSESQDKHYRIELIDKDKGVVIFGDGANGKIPPIGQGNVVADYRYNAQDDGNVGSNTIVVDKSGMTYVNSLWNPRPAAGWAAADGATEDTLKRVKIEGPASLRVKDVAISPDDLMDLAKRYTDSTGARPFGRARAIEEGFGPKTVELVLVARGGKLASPSQLDEFETYLNGDKFSVPPKAKHFVANQEVTCVNFVPRVFDVVATVEAPDDVTVEQIQNRLAEVLQPEALLEDGVNWTWQFGGIVPHSRLIHEIFEVDPRIKKVTISSPAGDTQLAARELPTPGTFTIIVIQPTS